MNARCSAYTMLVACLVLGGCAQKVPDGHWAGERETWRGWQGTWDQMTGWREWATPGVQAKYNTVKGEPGCTLWAGGPQRREVSQHGVHDFVNYDICPNAPVPARVGMRLDGRP